MIIYVQVRSLRSCWQMSKEKKFHQAFRSSESYYRRIKTIVEKLNKRSNGFTILTVKDRQGQPILGAFMIINHQPQSQTVNDILKATELSLREVLGNEFPYELTDRKHWECIISDT